MTFWLNRRALLGTMGAALALPLLECMLDSKGRIIREAHAAGVAPAVRFLGFFSRNGMPRRLWAPPAGSATNFQLPLGLKNLQPFAADTIQVTNLHVRHLKRQFHHTDGTKGLWTGYPMDNANAGFDVSTAQGRGISLQHLLDKKLTKDGSTNYALFAGLPGTYADRYKDGGRGSYQDDKVPSYYYENPQELYQRFAKGIKSDSGSTTSTITDPRQVSLLDFLANDSARLASRLGAADKIRLDQHLSTVRDIEKQLQVITKTCSPFPGGEPASPNFNRDEWVSQRVQDAAMMELMAKLIVFGFQCDVVRYVIFDIGNVPADSDDKGALMANADPVTKWDHHVSHNKEGTIDQNNPNHDLIINKKMAWWAMILQGMKNSAEGDKTVLYNSLSMYGSDISLGYVHSRENMPMVTVGQAGGRLQTGRLVDGGVTGSLTDNTEDDRSIGQMQGATSTNSLMAAVMTAMGVDTPTFGADNAPRLAKYLNP